MKRAEAERAEKIRLHGGAPDGAATAVAARPGTTGSDAPRTTVRPSRRTGDAAADAPEVAYLQTGGLMSPSGSLVCLTEPSSTIAEQYRAVRTWLLRHNTTGEHRSYVITSSVPQEGKSVTTVNLAVCLAEVRHLNVLMIDADLRGGSLAGLTGLPNRPGLADVLEGRATIDEAIQPTGIDNLAIMPAGRSEGTGAAEMLSSRTASMLFDEVRERFHYTLVDTPPVQTAADVGVIGGMCSAVLMVVRMHRTNEPLVRQSVRWLQANNLNVIGSICSAANIRKSRMSYPYQYGYRQTS
jgi:capsular exopolysaccharide synthesis family protein